MSSERHLDLVVHFDCLVITDVRMCTTSRVKKTYFAYDFICPSSIIAQALNAITDIRVSRRKSDMSHAIDVHLHLLPGNLDGLSIIEALNLCKDLLVSFDEISKLVQ